jgi:hypothetical protein
MSLLKFFYGNHQIPGSGKIDDLEVESRRD